MDLMQPMMVAALLVSGMGVALLGSVKVPLARTLQIDEARVGGLVSIFGFAMIPVILTAGILTDQLGPQPVLLAGICTLAGSLGVLAAARTYALALLAVVLFSAGWSLLINVCNVLTPVAFPGDITFATNLSNVFFGLGAFLTPLAVAYLVRRGPLARALIVLGILALVPALLTVGVDFAPPASDTPASTSSPTSGAAWETLLGDPILWLCGLALFFYGPLEASMAAWTTTYLGGRGLSEGTAAGWLAAFWLTFMGARLVTALTLPAESAAILIFALALACVGVLLAVVCSRSAKLAIGTVLAAGLIFGPIFPTIMAVLLGHFHTSVHGRAVGLLFAIGGIGWTTIPALIGAYTRRTNVQRGFLIAVAAAVGLSVVALVLVVYQGG